MTYDKKGVSLVEVMIGIVLFLVFLIPLWNLYIHSYGIIQVSKDELLTNIVSACLISEFSNKSFPQLVKLKKDHPNGVVQDKVYGTVIKATINFDQVINKADLYDFVEVKINLSQRILKPTVKILEYKYSVIVPRHF